ncbi:MAG TPA: DUF5671 domain-containing protein [Ktedonobacteraceae bacterium]|nr:DUF5671 domain-containing protein [Ktedonobacteraceae bacterium]
MVRNLYRFYLYTVSIALLIFIAVAIGRLLSTLLLFTPLRGSYETLPGQAQVIQALTFAGVTVVIAGALAVLHYWLIRRDIRNDPTAATSAIRAFFLNIAEAIGISLGVPLIGFGVILPLAQHTGASVVSAASFALPALVLVALLEAERRQTQVKSGAALTFERLHVYGVQVILLLVLSIAWYNAIRPIIDDLFSVVGFHQICGANDTCPNYNLFGLVVSVLWFVAAWLGYSWLVRKDTSLLVRMILHGMQFAYGVGLALFGLYTAIEVLLFPLFHVASSADVLSPYSRYDVVSPLTLGLLVVVVYNWLLRMAAKQGLIERVTLFLTENAIVAVLAAAAFWWGLGSLLYTALQAWVPVPQKPDPQDWASALAFLITGIGYFALDFYLRRGNRQDPSLAAGPRRGFVFALLGAGILGFAIGGAIALYAWVTAILGSPIGNWQQTTHVGLAAFLVGVILVALYLRTALQEHLLGGLSRKPTQVSPVALTKPGMPATVESILDDLLAGKISRDEAVEQIRALYGTSVGTMSGSANA